MKPHSNEPTFTDPVCGMKLSRKTAPEELELDGKVYCFCAKICREAFEAEPEKFRHRHRQHGTTCA
ncbi:MAG TPA: YHS domain-containing protein [Phycisphaerae bacterium]|nr:YHS domain-containing protein [Phycisphaerae bacterium]